MAAASSKTAPIAGILWKKTLNYYIVCRVRCTRCTEVYFYIDSKSSSIILFGQTFVQHDGGPYALRMHTTPSSGKNHVGEPIKTIIIVSFDRPHYPIIELPYHNHFSVLKYLGCRFDWSDEYLLYIIDVFKVKLQSFDFLYLDKIEFNRNFLIVFIIINCNSLLLL